MHRRSLPACARGRVGSAVLSIVAACLGIAAAGQAVAQTYSRTEVTTYYDDTDVWVLGQTARVTCVVAVPISNRCDGDVTEETSFEPTLALPTTRRESGLLVATYGFDTSSDPSLGQRGTLASVADGAGKTTRFSAWRRGIPQTTTHADGSAQSAFVDPGTGLIRSITDELGNTSAYAYDPMGRITDVDPPDEADMAWNGTHSAFERVGAEEYGLAAGHWRRTTTTGAATTITWYDALWRPVLQAHFDASDASGARSFVRKTFDSENRVTFESYPSATSSPTSGVWTSYDALGRVVSVGQDTELSPALQVTRTDYLAGFQTRVTNPRGFATTTSFQAFDQPSTEVPVRIDAPEGVTTVIQRDPFGKPLAITRSGPSP